jgi:chemotaxis protein methyltransferase CheR
MTINESSFFRDQAPFELLRSKLLPQLIEKRSRERSLRFWSAACSSGQEAYSLAMLIQQHFSEVSEWKIEIVGTDIHAGMIRRAQAGRYHRVEINRGLPARLLIQYFIRDGEEWRSRRHCGPCAAFSRKTSYMHCRRSIDTTGC